MGGDTGGNDCVHVIDARTEWDAAVGRSVGTALREDTDVIIADEHGNVCQYTYQEWDAFRLRMADGTFDHVGDRPRPEGIVPVAGARDALSRKESFPLPPTVTYWNDEAPGPFDISRTGQPTGIDYDATGPRVPLDRGAEA